MWGEKLEIEVVRKAGEAAARYVMEGGVTLLTEPGATELTTSLIRRSTVEKAAANV